MNLTVIGTGYVGLVSGTCFADSGNDVTCVDIDENKINQLREGKIPIYEPGLEPIFKRCRREDRLHFTTELDGAVKDADIVFLCLPTPPGGDGQADLSAVMQVASELGPLIEDYTVIVNKSTVPVGTDGFSGKTFDIWGLSFKPETDDIREAPALYIAEELVERGAALLAYNPEAISTFKQPTSQQVPVNATFVNNQKEALNGVDALIIYKEWNKFRRPTIDNFDDEMKKPVIFDGRNLYDLKRAEKAGIIYISVGRPTIKKEQEIEEGVFVGE